jgi:hypothetical protein
MSEAKVCSACAKPIDGRNEGLELWGSWFCSLCFIGTAAKTHKEMSAEDLATLRAMGREMAGLLPAELLEMILVGYFKRASGGKAGPAPEELARTIGEIQRITAFSVFRHVLSLLKTWQDMFNEFVQGQETEIRDKVKRLTNLE